MVESQGVPAARRAVLVGCGGIAGEWINAVRMIEQADHARPKVELVGLCDLKREQIEAFAERHDLGELAWFTDVAEAASVTGADLVFDTTVPPAHETVVTTALRAGCDVIGEKPMAATLDAARRMLEVARETGRTHAVMQNRRFNPAIRVLRERLAAGAIGELEEIHADFFLGPAFKGFRAEMEDPLLVDMAIHTFDQARFISGADPVSVYCHSFNPKRSWYRGDASAIVIFEMTGGLVFTYRGSWCAEALGTSWESQWRVIGEGGTATWDGHQDIRLAPSRRADDLGLAELELNGEGGGHHAPAIPPMTLAGHAGCIAHSLESMAAGRAPMTAGTDNIRSLAMVEAAVRSARRGQKEAVRW